MSNVCLKFTDEAQAQSVLFTEIPAVLDAEGEVVTEAQQQPNYRNIDTIGVIHKPTGEVDEEGLPVMAALPGWHINVFLLDGEDAEALEPFKVIPTNPVRVWAGL